MLGKSKVVPVPTMTAYRGNGDIAPLFLNLSVRQMCVVNSTSCLLYSRENVLVPIEWEAEWAQGT
jgi:hypothetical protein